MLIKYCPMCRKPMPYGKIYCNDCSALNVRSKKHAIEYNRSRDKKYSSFYNSAAWKRLCAKKLSDCNYQCEICRGKGIIKIAEDIHHKMPIKKDWDKRLDYDNLLAVCVACHNRIEPKNYLKG